MNFNFCEECANLKKKDGVWCCEECFMQPIEQLDECPEDFSLEEFNELDRQAKDVKISHKARKETQKEEKKEKTSRPKKVSDQKKEVFAYILEKLSEFAEENDEKIEILNENKLISLTFGGKSYKIDLIETGNKRKKA